MRTISFAKGHGTGNDFVLVPALDGDPDLSMDDVRFLADRRTGIGGDGVIRVVPVADAPEAVRSTAGEADWFMDYRNHDGSIAQLCGNGTRVFARYLLEAGLAEGPDVAVATRAGTKRVRLSEDGFRVDLGQWRLGRPQEADERGVDSLVTFRGLPEPLPALSLDLGNPHTVVALPAQSDLAAIDLTAPPQVDPTPPEGSNVEVVRPIAASWIDMRVHERGVGETRSCGTGAAAAALATWVWAGRPGEQTDWQVGVPGGRLGVHIDADRVALSGPAQIVAEGTVRLPG